jgi:hypothetical protein
MDAAKQRSGRAYSMAHLIGRLVACQACDTPDLLILVCRVDLASQVRSDSGILQGCDLMFGVCMYSSIVQYSTVQYSTYLPTIGLRFTVYGLRYYT